jgi:hypothetical protein
MVSRPGWWLQTATGTLHAEAEDALCPATSSIWCRTDGLASITEGTELVDTEAVRIEAKQALAEFARDTLPGVETKHTMMMVRDEHDQQHFVLELVFSITDAGTELP